MALWNNLGKKASGTTAKAVQQAKMFSEVTRINGLIADEIKAIENTWIEIGKLYVATHHDDFEDVFADLMNAVIRSEQLIEDYQEQIQRAKGVCICSNCGSEIPKESSFCSNCGTAAPKKEVSVPSNICRKCGTTMAEGMRFCTSCGSPLVEFETETAEAPAVVKPKCCSNCGAELEDDMIFCSECGTKVG